MCEAPSWRLEPRLLPPHPISTYTYRVIISPRMCGGNFSSIKYTILCNLSLILLIVFSLELAKMFIGGEINCLYYFLLIMFLKSKWILRILTHVTLICFERSTCVIIACILIFPIAKIITYF